LELLGRITNVYGQWNRSVQPDIGWPKKYPIDEATLNKYGYKSMHQFKNWRWYKGLGGGPVVDLGAHQIDVFNWFLETPPSSVAARGGTHYYDKKTHEWYDTVMVVLEYETGKGIVSAYYQAITTNGYGGYYEVFMGDKGSLEISESAGRGSVYPDRIHPTEWERWVRLGYLKKPVEEEKREEPEEGVVLDVRDSIVPPSYELSVQLNDPYHKPHLENFFKAIRGEARLNCPPEVAYRTAITLLKVNEAVEAGRTLDFKPEEFAV
jgi:predicted dehydrogenase